MTTLQLAFQIIYFLDSGCTVYHQGGEDNSTFNVALQVSGAYDDSQPNATVFPAQCDGIEDDSFRVYANTDPSHLPDLEGSGDIETIYFAGSYMNLTSNVTCELFDDDTLFQPYEGTPVTGPFYVSTVVPNDGNYSAECVLTSAPSAPPTLPTLPPTISPTISPTAAPTTLAPTYNQPEVDIEVPAPTTVGRKPTQSTYGFFIGSTVILSGIAVVVIVGSIGMLRNPHN